MKWTEFQKTICFFLWAGLREDRIDCLLEFRFIRKTDFLKGFAAKKGEKRASSTYVLSKGSLIYRK